MIDTGPLIAPLTAPANGTARQQFGAGSGDACGAGQRTMLGHTAVALS